MTDSTRSFGAAGLSWQIAGDLGTRIVSGEFVPGDVLPKESSLGTEFDVGRSAIREAMKLLSAKGLVDARPRRGTVVRQATDWNFLDPDVLFWAQKGSPDKAFLLELVEMRMAVEPEAAALAARRGDARNIHELRSAYLGMEAAARGDADPIASDLAFHQALVQASGNRFMQPLVALIRTALKFSFRTTNAAVGDPVGDLRAHENILLAIEGEKPDAARNAARVLLETAREVIENNATKKNENGSE